MDSDVQVDSLIYLEFGQLDFADANVRCERLEVFSSGSVELDLGSAQIEITGNRFKLLPIYEWRESLHFSGELTCRPGTSRIELTDRKPRSGSTN